MKNNYYYLVTNYASDKDIDRLLAGNYIWTYLYSFSKRKMVVFPVAYGSDYTQ